MRIWPRALVVLALMGCTNKLEGDISVNGEKFEIESCRNGSVHGFRGVEVTSKSGDRLRLGAKQSGKARVILMPKGEDTGKDVGACGSFAMSNQNSTVNDVKNVEGKATLDCTGDGVTVKGTLEFENCH